MGMFGSSRSSCSNCENKKVVDWDYNPNNNPNPKNFKIIKALNIGEYLILHVSYPDAKNFEGRKILVYKGFNDSGVLLGELNNSLDPHFSDKIISPIARFTPTEEGAKMAIAFVEMLVNENS